jgi:hypothetical protein
LEGFFETPGCRFALAFREGFLGVTAIGVISGNRAVFYATSSPNVKEGMAKREGVRAKKGRGRSMLRPYKNPPGIVTDQ